MAKRATAQRTRRPKGSALRVEDWPIDDVKPYPGNPKDHSEAQVAKIARVIADVGWRQPIVVDEDGTVIVGHGRLMAARHLGLTTVPVHVARGLSEEQKRAYRIADNRLGEEAQWDSERLKAELAKLTESDGFDMALTGFNTAQLKRYVNGSSSSGGGPVGMLGEDEHLVLLECSDETQAKALYDEMSERGITCRLMS